MSTYFLAPALVQLRDEVNRLFPRRDKASDGWIGDPSHAARASDHNPDWGANGRLYGVVRAVDIDIDDNDSTRDLRREILNACIGDPRVWYVISNGIIYSSTYGFAARRYTGTNGHFAHVHVSLRHEVGEFDTTPWFVPLPAKVRVKLIPVSLHKVRKAFLEAAAGHAPEFNNGVGRIQRSLNTVTGSTLTVDGVAGPATLNTWGRFERNLPGAVSGRPRIPDASTLPHLARGRFRIIT